jgi:hypothetical protein
MPCVCICALIRSGRIPEQGLDQDIYTPSTLKLFMWWLRLAPARCNGGRMAGRGGLSLVYRFFFQNSTFKMWNGKNNTAIENFVKTGLQIPVLKVLFWTLQDLSQCYSHLLYCPFFRPYFYHSFYLASTVPIFRFFMSSDQRFGLHAVQKVPKYKPGAYSRSLGSTLTTWISNEEAHTYSGAM